MALAARCRLGRFEILAPLGSGGMGEVYRARDEKLGRDVALKVLPAAYASDPERLRRFEREARAVGSLDDPNILTVHDVGVDGGAPYIVTELLEGETLREALGRGGVSTRRAVELGADLALGLAAAHAKGVVHRDLKPENVFLTKDGRLKILDFGLAKLHAEVEGPSELTTEPLATRPGVPLGTLGYMSPEQLRGQWVDARSDVFAFGVVLYEMLAGRSPFRRDSAAEMVSAILKEDPPRLSLTERSVSPALERLVQRCLEKRAEDRFHSAHDVALALRTLAGSPGLTAQPARGEEEASPYPGLRAFGEEDASVFFGREREVEALWARIRERRLLAVIGPSGAGKTSFVRAGVMAGRPVGWAALVLTPGKAPLASLGRALVPELARDPEALRDLVACDDPDVLVELFGRWRRGQEDALVVVDQLEELFTLSGPEVQEKVAGILGRLAEEADVHVLVSLRDDFLMRCHEQAALAPVFAEITPLGPLTREGLRGAIVEPARRRGFRFEDEALVDEMVSGVEDPRGALPLVAFATARLWERRDTENSLLTREACRAIGGVEGALAQHAEATLEGIGTERQGLVREIFRNLVTAQGTRAAMDREELLSAFPERTAAERALKRLVDARLLTSYEVEEGEGRSRHRIEIVHESLLRAWPRLVRWRAQDEEGALLRDQLKQAAHLWEEKGRSADLLWTGTAYRELELWRERYPGQLTALEQAFVAAAVERARRRRRLRWFAAGSLLGAAVLAAAVTGTLWRRSEALRERAQAEALRAEASTLLALGRAELDHYPLASLAYARKSLEVTDTPGGRRLAVDALWRSPSARILPLDEHVVWYADFSPDGRWLAGYAFDGNLVLVPSDGGPVRVLPGPRKTGFPPQIRFLPDGRAVLTRAQEEPSVRIYSVPDGGEIRRFEPMPPVSTVRLLLRVSPARRGLLFWWWPTEGPALTPVAFGLWPYDGGPPTVVGYVPAGIDGAAVDPDGTRVLLRRGRRLFLRPLQSSDLGTAEQLVGTLDGLGSRRYLGFIPHGAGAYYGYVEGRAGRLRAWELDPSPPPEPRAFELRDPDGNFLPVWDSTGTRLAWGSSALNAVWVWNLADSPDAAPTLLRRPDMSTHKNARFAPGPDWLVVAHQGPLAFWALSQPRSRVLAGHAQNVSRLVFTRDSRSLISCGLDDVRLWPLGPGRGGVRRIAPGHRGWCMDAALAPDGERLALVGSQGGWLASALEGRGRWLAGGGPEYAHLLHAAAWDASGSRVALASSYVTDASQQVLLFDSASGAERALPLVPPGETGKGYEWGVLRLAFAPDGRLVTGGSGGVRWLDPDTGTSDWIWRVPREIDVWTAMSADGRRLAAVALQRDKAAPAHGAVLVDLASSAVERIQSHGGTVTAVGLDATGGTLVTGDEEGVVRVGPAEGSEPHRLCCHAGVVQAIAVSPDGKWIASASGGEIRLWPMPDVTQPPLHTLPYAELMAKLRALTNLQVVEDAASSTGYRLDVGPFPGWKDVPTW